MRRIVKILLIIPVLYLFIIPAYFVHSSNAEPCSGIEICITDSADYHFVTKTHLLSLVHSENKKILGKPVKEIPLAEIEARINVLRELKTAEVYLSIDGTLHVFVDQRNPVMRVMPDSGGDFFIDEDGVLIRKRNLYTPRLHIVGGNVKINQDLLNGVSLLDTGVNNQVLKDIYHLVRYINRDSFWSAQIDQIYVDNSNEINLVPRVGNQIIHLGDAYNYEGKLRNLEVFYEKILPEVGWNKYSMINLEFKDQIVCKKR